MSSNILFVFEGQDTEKIIVTRLKRYFFNENVIIHSALGGDIYELYRQLSLDQDLDLFSLLKEFKFNKKSLSKFNKNDFAEIYLFFDYDGHATLADDNKILELLSLFNEETLYGKLFISYPMVESLRHISDNIEFKELRVKAKESIGYKQIVSNECNPSLNNLNKYDIDIWNMLIKHHILKANYIVNDHYIYPIENITQLEIFKNQLVKYIKPELTISVLNSFPMFFLEYYGVEKTYELIT
jgi:hypothetical protein